MVSAAAAAVLDIRSLRPASRVLVAYLAVSVAADGLVAHTTDSLAVGAVVASAVKVAVRIPAAAVVTVVVVAAAAAVGDLQVSRRTVSNPTMGLVGVVDACSVRRRLRGRIGGLGLWDCRRRLSRVLVVSMSDGRFEGVRVVGRIGLVFGEGVGDRIEGIVDTLMRWEAVDIGRVVGRTLIGAVFVRMVHGFAVEERL